MNSWIMLSNNQISILNNLDQNIFEMMSADKSGHDYYHIKRVVNLTSRLISETDNEFVIKSIAYLHDVFDDKVLKTDNLELSLQNLFKKWNLDFEGFEDEIILGVSQIGYKGGFGVQNKIRSAQIVSDADYLDAMGAIGIARTFYYAGSKGTPLYDPTLKSVEIDSLSAYRTLKRNAIEHLDEKLVKLYDLLETEKAKRIGKARHQRLLDFYQDFYDEMNESEM
ncbi:HD domain-containing protein [Erysipelothrix sp. strain 2 (EsS2-7-Brazil)]|uniref:HD domain-containing protein n=1 Tax=Erysipelothrix sp. strain 2 (EsS2-7-Brazil) TaxID=2500579 RepID=UPI001F44DC5C|nr:phosphohydrolase [Erysipelothrix sp. strain 2 (EsS2-7-Brazil)]